MDKGHTSPEEAARDDIPERFVTILKVQIDGDRAHVWMLTNDGPPFEGYEQFCERMNGRWYATDGCGGLATDAPRDVLDKAARLGY